MSIEDRIKNFSIYKSYMEWFSRSKPNDRFIYHIGQSIHDGIIPAYMGKFVFQESTKGKVYLVARKIAPREYEFLVVKASEIPVRKLRPIDYSVA